MRKSDLAAAARVRAELRSGDARRAREATGVSGAAMARILGVSRMAVSDWETGRKPPTDGHAVAYGQLLAILTGRAA